MMEYYERFKYDSNVSEFQTVERTYSNNNLLKPEPVNKSIKVEAVHPEPKQPAV